MQFDMTSADPNGSASPTTQPHGRKESLKRAAAPSSLSPSSPLGGLSITRHFSDPAVPPAAQLNWTIRTAAIKDEAGKTIFTQDVRAPDSWSDQAVRVVASKYLYGDAAKGFDPRQGGREDSILQLVYRVAATITAWGEADGYFDTKADAVTFHDELSWLLLNQYGSFNSPVWFNVGISDQYGVKGAANGWVWDEENGRAIKCQDAYKSPQGSACFLQSVTDDMESIADLLKSEMMLFKGGSGTGTDLSPLRSTKEKLAGGGKPSGPVSFMEVYDASAGVVKSGGKTRRAAKMQILKCVHPDIVEFVECKTKEEDKARALIAAGYDSSFNGEAYRSVKFQNANLSVSATDDFMEKSGFAPGDPNAAFGLRARTTGEVIETIDASALLDKIAESTHRCGDPGMFFVDTINRWHTCPNSGPIETCNPCGEYLFINDSACNLASLNFMKFRRADGSFDVKSFRAACRTFIVAQEILVDRASYPTPKIAENSHKFRPLGLGGCGLGALIMAAGLPYDSEEGRSMAGAITATMTGEAYRTSAEMARRFGAFEGFAANQEPMLKVMHQHRAAIDWDNSHPDSVCDLWWAAQSIWEEVVHHGGSAGYRNSQVSLYAPTGTIAFMMDSGHSTGIEPCLALVQYKTLAGGGMLRITNPAVELALKTLGYDDSQIARILAHIEKHDTIKDVLIQADSVGSHVARSGLNNEHLPVFDCAFPPAQGGRSIAWEGHVKMLAAVQPFISGSSSKTINMPKDSTVQEIKDAYRLAWKLGVKDIAIYRDGSKDSQPVSTSKASASEPARVATVDEVKNVYGEGIQVGIELGQNTKASPGPRRERLLDTRSALAHKLSVNGVEAYLHVGHFPDGRPGELFVTMAKEGSTLGGLMDAWATAVSLLFQYGVPLDVIVAKFSGGHFEPYGFTHDPDIRIAKSLIDYIARWLGVHYLPGYREAHAPRIPDDRMDVAHAVTSYEDVTEAVSNGYLPNLPNLPKSSGRITAAHGPLCPDCGSMTVPAGRCWVCSSCGTSVGGCG